VKAGAFLLAAVVYCFDCCEPLKTFEKNISPDYLVAMISYRYFTIVEKKITVWAIRIPSGSGNMTKQKEELNEVEER